MDCTGVYAMKLRKTRSRILMALLACVLLTGAWQQNSVGATTLVIRYMPSSTLPDSGREGYCWTDSIAAPYRADAWRCMEGNAIHDPCFSLPERQRVVCGTNPAAGKNGFALRLTKPLPKPDTQSVPVPRNWAWLVELNDGTTCSPFTGTMPFIAGEVGTYGCSSKKKGQQIMLLGELDNRQPLWTARKATLVESGAEWIIKSSEAVPIRKVWQ